MATWYEKWLALLAVIGAAIVAVVLSLWVQRLT
jgi:hypothetical protein